MNFTSIGIFHFNWNIYLVYFAHILFNFMKLHPNLRVIIFCVNILDYFNSKS